jgi:hypothetical protein
LSRPFAASLADHISHGFSGASAPLPSFHRSDACRRAGSAPRPMPTGLRQSTSPIVNPEEVMLHHRVIATGVFMLGFGIVLAQPAAAQQTANDDAAYCGRLSATYNRFLGDSTPSVETLAAEADCGQHPAQAIAQLEKLLQSKGYPLPEKTVGQRQ